jgi:pseudouridylate synthase
MPSNPRTLRQGVVALETTLLLHGVPKGEGAALGRTLEAIIREHGATPATVGVVSGEPVVGLSAGQLAQLLDHQAVPKANTSNLGLLLASKSHAATTVSTTMELAAAAGVQVFATGGLGGVHKGFAQKLDVSADLAAFTRFPVAVVTSGVKSLLDVISTREALETLGVPVVGWRTDRFPAFYTRDGGTTVDARFDDIDALARFISGELARTGRGIVVCNPIDPAFEISASEFEGLLARAEASLMNGGVGGGGGVSGRDVTPRLLGELHRISQGRTLRANLELVKSNAAVAARIAAAMTKL